MQKKKKKIEELTWQQFVEIAVVFTLIQKAGERNRSGLSLKTRATYTLVDCNNLCWAQCGLNRNFSHLYAVEKLNKQNVWFLFSLFFVFFLCGITLQSLYNYAAYNSIKGAIPYFTKRHAPC